MYCSKVESTKTGYFIRKHQNETVSCGTKNRYMNMDGEGGNLIVLRYAEILLTYAEAKNEVSGPDQSIYDAINAVRRRSRTIGKFPDWDKKICVNRSAMNGV